ncbi:MAG: LPS-assembly protein LptD [Hyphomicrobiaceae bacterium]|nr:LPS-assembly protein LptD [Hyphomicrobiaceae bacterium]
MSAASLAGFVFAASVQPAAAQQPLSVEQATAGPSAAAFPKTPGGMFGGKPKLDKTQPLHLQGDQLIYDTKGNKVIARGNVEIFYNNNALRADEVIYDQSANTLAASGNVELKEANGNIIRADRYKLTDDFRDGFVESLSVVTKDESRITADGATRREGNVTEFTNGKYTACKPKPGDPPLWCIGARKIIHDQAAQTITYQDAQFELFGVPIFYAPYFQHADPTVKRKSGFLIPNYGTSGDLGTFVETPYFFNLAPNYDLLFHPSYLSKQGVLWQLDWRHRLENGQYNIKLAGIEQDGDDLPDTFLSDQRRRELDGWRGSVETKGRFSLGSWWTAGWDATFESDDSFRRFYKLDSILLTERVNRAYLEGISDRNYLGINIYDMRGLTNFDTPQAEAVVHPQIDQNYIFEQPALGGELSIANNAYSLSRNDADNVSNTQNVTKLTSEVKWRRKFTDAIGISYTPFGELRGDVYQLNDYFDPIAEELESSDTVTRGVATGGATVSYPWVANTASASHVIEPIGQVVARQAEVSQERLPNEDAKSLVFDDTNLFDTDKFSGFDRIETGTRANVGVQYTFQANSGGYARVLAGQSFHLGGENSFADPGIDPDGVPVFSPITGLQNDRSDYVLGFYVAPTDIFRVISQTRFDEDSLDLRRADVSARFAFGPLTTQATYTFQDATLYYDENLGVSEDPLRQDQQDIIASAGLKLSDRWTVFGAMRYDLDDGQRLTDSIQLRYGDECFAVSLSYNETFIIDPERELAPDQTVMLRFEFKNLGEYKYKTDALDHTYGTDDKSAFNQ